MIKLFNNLNTVQPVRVRDRQGMYYSVFIESKKSTEIEGYQVTDDLLNKVRNGSILDLTNVLLPKTTNVEIPKDLDQEKSTEEITTLEDVSENLSSNTINVDETQEKNQNAEESSSSVFVCEVCGYECASSRGLAMHKSKSHK